MTTNTLKLVIVGALALACIIALAIDSANNSSWAVPVLTLLVGYVVGNAAVTSGSGVVSPIISKQHGDG